MRKATIAALCLAYLAGHSEAARNYDYEARAAAASALALQALASTDNVTPAPQVKTCHCSEGCVCGCNEGQPCDCTGQSTRPIRQWYSLAEKLPPGEYRQIGGRYYRVGDPPATPIHVQPQQYAIPTQRYTYSGFAGSCGPGG